MARVLLVDDDRDVRDGIQRVLEVLGHEVIIAEDGRGASSLLQVDPCDLVITDINMPEMDGVELIIALRSTRPEIPIVAISGGGVFPKELLLDNAKVLGALLTLPKPVGLPELEAALEQVLDASGPGH